MIKTSAARWIAGASSALAVGLLGSGCSDGAARAPAPTGSATSQSPSPTVAVPPPTLPAEAMQPDAPGAAAFARHWYDVAQHAYLTGDSEPLIAVSDPECDVCQSIIDTVEGATASGARLSGGAVTIHAAQAQPPDAAGTSLVSVLLSQEAVTLTPASGTATVDEPLERLAIEFYANFKDGRWTAVGMR